MTIELRNSDRLPTPPGYSHASVGPAAGHVVHLAGQIGTLADGTHVDGLAAQVAQAMRNLADAVVGVGASLDDLAKLNVYVVGWRASMAPELFAGLSDARQDRPIGLVPITLVGVQSLFLDESLVEIDGVAVVPAL